MSGCNFPSVLTAGDTLSFTETVPGYPASAGWVVAYRFVPQDAAGTAIDLASTPDGDRHAFAATSAATAAWLPGFYAWARFAVLAGERSTLSRGFVTINPDPAAAAPGFDGRSQNRKALEAIEAVIEKRATLDQDRYRINNRELYRTPIADLLRLRAHYAAAVARDEAKASGRSLFGAAVRVTF